MKDLFEILSEDNNLIKKRKQLANDITLIKKETKEKISELKLMETDLKITLENNGNEIKELLENKYSIKSNLSGIYSLKTAPKYAEREKLEIAFSDDNNYFALRRKDKNGDYFYKSKKLYYNNIDFLHKYEIKINNNTNIFNPAASYKIYSEQRSIIYPTDNIGIDEDRKCLIMISFNTITFIPIFNFDYFKEHMDDILFNRLL